MTTSVQHILHSFELLSEAEKWQLASEIILRTLEFDLPPLTDEELVLNAEEIFLALDKKRMNMRNPTTDLLFRGFANLKSLYIIVQ